MLKPGPIIVVDDDLDDIDLIAEVCQVLNIETANEMNFEPAKEAILKNWN